MNREKGDPGMDISLECWKSFELKNWKLIVEFIKVWFDNFLAYFVTSENWTIIGGADFIGAK